MRKDSAGWSGLFRYLIFTVLLAAVMWLFLAYSPMGVSERLDKYTQDLFNSRAGSWVYPNDRQQDLTVLLLTDEVVDGVLHGQWPAPYSFHASVLDDLLVHQPRAVFIDYYWMNLLKPGADYLVSVLESYREEGVPVYLAAPDENWLAARWPELVGLVIPVSAAVAMDPTDFVARSYPQESQGLRSAAFAIAEDQFAIRADHRGALDIFWGTAENLLNHAWMQGGQATHSSILGSLTQGFDGVNTPIPYTTTVFVRDLLNPVAESEDEALRELDEHLKGRVVIYGASLSGIQDMVFTPTRAILPGAYYHAMAIDNLLTWGARFKASVPSRVAPQWAEQVLVIFHFATLLAIAALVCRLKFHTPLACAATEQLDAAASFARQSPTFWRETRIKAAVLALVVTACAVQFFVLDLSVAVWAGFLEMLGIGVVLDRLNVIERLLAWLESVRSCIAKYKNGSKGERNAEVNPRGDGSTGHADDAVRECRAD